MSSSRVPIVLLLLGGLVFGCLVWWVIPAEPTIRVGFVGSISGRMADLGVGGRDGVILATEEINRAGGITGRQIDLLIRDDQHDPTVAAQVDQELIDQGVVALIGHMTSTMTLIGASIANRSQVLLFSPTASTTALSNQEDWVFRLYPDSRQENVRLADLAYNRLNLRKMILVRDDQNRAYTQDYGDWFASEFSRRGGQIVTDLHFTSSRKFPFSELAERIASAPGDGILLLCNAVDTALLTQKLRQRGVNHPILVSEWSTTEELISLGGEATEGLMLIQSVIPLGNSPREKHFRDQFLERFGYPPDFSAIKAYDAAHILFTALKKDPNPRKLRETIVGIQYFQGVQTRYRLTPTGDAEQKLFVMEIHKGHYRQVE